MEKQVILILAFFGMNLSLCAQNNCENLFPKVQLASLDSLIEGYWDYQYSFNTDSSFVDYEDPIHFYLSSKKTNKYTTTNEKVHAFRSSSCLKKLEFFEGYKGIACYPRLRSDSTDTQGYLIDCYVDLMMKIEPDIEYGSGEPDLNIISLTYRVMVIKKRDRESNTIEYHVFAKE